MIKLLPERAVLRMRYTISAGFIAVLFSVVGVTNVWAQVGSDDLFFTTVGNSRVSGHTGVADDSNIYSFTDNVADAPFVSTGLPGNADFDAISLVEDNHFFASFNAASTVVPGLGAVKDADIVEYNDGAWSLYLQGAALGLISGAHDIDAFSLHNDITYFSILGTTRIGDLRAIDDADVLSWNGTEVVKVWDAIDQGLPSGADIDGLVVIAENHFLLSFGASGTGVPTLGSVADEDIVEYFDGTWSMYFDGSDYGLTANGHDIDGFSLLANNNPTVPDILPPDWVNPEVTVLSVTAGSIELAWSAAQDDNQVVGYRVVYTDGGENITIDTSDTALSVSGLSPSTAYSFSIEALDLAGNISSTGPTASVTTMDAEPPVEISDILFSTLGNTAISGIDSSADDADIYSWNGSSYSALLDASATGLTGPADVDAMSILGNGDILVSFLSNTLVPGLGVVQDEDLVAYDGNDWSLYFDATAAGLTAGGHDIDAVSVYNNLIYFSTVGVVSVPGLNSPDDADVYSWNGSVFARVFDASDAGLPTSADIDALSVLENSRFLMSFNASQTTVPDIGRIQDEDIVEFHDGVWSVFFDGTANLLVKGGHDIDAFTTSTMTAGPPNVAPVAENDAVTIEFQSVEFINVLDNDEDSDGTLGLVTVESLPGKGSAVAQADGTIRYEHTDETSGTDTFTYSVVDNDGEPSNVATVIVTISEEPNVAPLAVDDAATVVAGAEVSIDVLSNDLDEGVGIDASAVTVSIVTASELITGTALVQSDGTILYTAPSVTEETTVTFNYSVTDADGASAEATVTVTVSPANTAPMTVDDSIDENSEALTVAIGSSLTIAVLSNDSDDGELDESSVVTSLPDQAVAQENGTVVYTPVEGTDTDSPVTFSYTVKDNEGAISNSATVTVSVSLPKFAPVAVNDTGEVTSIVAIDINVAVNDTDEDGSIDPATVALNDDANPDLKRPDNGHAEINSTSGVVTYFPEAEVAPGTIDTFEYTVKDDDGLKSEAGTVTITFVNNQPIAVADTVEVTALTTVVIDVATNDTGIAGAIVPNTVAEGPLPPTFGTILIDPATGFITYAPNIGSPGDTVDQFSYTIEDDQGLISEPGIVTVEYVNIQPVAVNDMFDVSASGATELNVVLNDTDADGTVVATTVAEGSLLPSHGSIVIDPASGLISYSPNHMAAFGTVDQFSYTVEDELGLQSEPATVSVTLVPGAIIQTHHEMVPNPVYGSEFRVVDECKGVSDGCSWDNANTWLPAAVPSGDSLVIVDGHVQIRDQNALALSIGVYPEGKLTFATNADTRLQVADLLVLQGGTLEIGNENSPIDSGNSAEVVFRDLPFDSQDPEQHLRGLLALDGVVRVHGRELGEAFLRTESGAAQNSIEVELAESALSVGWRVGDSVVIPTSAQCRTTSEACTDQTDERTITGISANGLRLTLNQSLQFDHPGASDDEGNLEFTPHVINKSRNITFRSENPSGVRGHFLLHGRADVDLRYAELLSLGRTNISNLGVNNQKGRYPVHAHHLIGPVSPQQNGRQFTLVGNTVDFGAENDAQDRKWGISIHGSHYGLIENNIVDHASGAGIVLESGEESSNIFRENFVVRVIGGNGEREEDTDPVDGTKLGRAGTGYWFNGGGRNFFYDNVAAAVHAGANNGDCVYCYGFKFDNVFKYNGPVYDQLTFPLTQGADPFMMGGETISTYSVGVNNFVGNESYGVPNGLTVWWECTEFDATYKPIDESCTSRLESFNVWHHHRWGYFGYETNNMTLDGFVVRGDPAALNSNSNIDVVGLEFSDYMQRNLNIINADIQNVRSGINMASFRDVRSATGLSAGINTVENSYIVATEGVNVWMPFSVNGNSGLSPQTTILQNVQFDYPGADPGSEDRAYIRVLDRAPFDLGNGVDSIRNDVIVNGYNGDADIDLYIVPEYQGSGFCNDNIGRCHSEVSARYGDIKGGHIYPITDAPVAGDDPAIAVVDVGGTVTINNLLANDSDTDGTLIASTVAIAQFPFSGTVEVLSDGSVTYIHDGISTELTDTFGYTVEDDVGAISNIALVTLSITPPPNQKPLAVNDTDSVIVGGSVAINVVANDDDLDGVVDPGTVVISTSPATGTAVVALPPEFSGFAAGYILFTPDNTAGVVTFEYRVKDDDNEFSDPATVTINVTALPNDAPVAEDDTVEVASGSFVNIDVLANDEDDAPLADATISVENASPQYGQVSVVADELRYEHDGTDGFLEPEDSFTYTVVDAFGKSASAQVTVVINEPNLPPVASNDILTIGLGDSPPTIDVLSNDFDHDHDSEDSETEHRSIDPTSVQVITNLDPLIAQVSVDETDGSIEFTYHGDSNAQISFEYTVNDKQGLASNFGQVIVDIVDSRLLPLHAVDDEAVTTVGETVKIEILKNDEGPVVGSTVDFVNSAQPKSGTLNKDPLTGDVFYMPQVFDITEPVTDTFNYTVEGDPALDPDAEDEFGYPVKFEATITVTILPELSLAKTAQRDINEPVTIADITDLVLITGQSNVTGSQADYDVTLDDISLQVFAYTSNDDWEVADLHQAWDVDGWHPGNGSISDPTRTPYNSFAFHFAKTVVENDPSRVVGIIVAGAQGEGILHWDEGSEFSFVIEDKVLAALNAQGVKSSIDGILWHQGETDWQFDGTSDPDAKNADMGYPEKLGELISRYRSKNWFTDGKPFICGEATRALVNDKMHELNTDNDPWTACVGATDLSTKDANLLATPPNSGTYFDTEGLRTLGYRYGIKYLEMNGN